MRLISRYHSIFNENLLIFFLMLSVDDFKLENSAEYLQGKSFRAEYYPIGFNSKNNLSNFENRRIKCYYSIV